jgi:hypothetical protein
VSEITWHLAVYQRAVHGRHEAQLWWTGHGPRLGWCIYQVGGLDTVAEGSGVDEADAKKQAEAALLRLAAEAGQ